MFLTSQLVVSNLCLAYPPTRRCQGLSLAPFVWAAMAELGMYPKISSKIWALASFKSFVMRTKQVEDIPSARLFLSAGGSRAWNHFQLLVSYPVTDHGCQNSVQPVHRRHHFNEGKQEPFFCVSCLKVVASILEGLLFYHADPSTR